jgi:hypothetical protein
MAIPRSVWKTLLALAGSGSLLLGAGDAGSTYPDRPRPSREPVAATATPTATARGGAEAMRCELDAGTKDARGFYRSDVWPEGEVVLTFDDGPHPSHTGKVLDLLQKYRLRATFFLVGANIRAKTIGLVKRMLAEGHTIGSHSYNHDVGMAVRDYGERSIEYIRGQHETTQILIELALIAASEADFDRMFRKVFEKKGGTYLAASSLRKDWPSFASRHALLLAERGYGGGRRPYPVVFSRPPAGTPYVGNSSPAQKKLYDTAMARLGWLNVMWHGESGDTHPSRKHDAAFLSQNLRYHSRRGGIILIHDYIRRDALEQSLKRMANDEAVEIVPLETAVERKFQCGSQAVLVGLKGGRSG